METIREIFDLIMAILDHPTTTAIIAAITLWYRAKFQTADQALRVVTDSIEDVSADPNLQKDDPKAVVQKIKSLICATASDKGVVARLIDKHSKLSEKFLKGNGGTDEADN